MHAGSVGHPQGPISSANRRRAVSGLAAAELKSGNTAEALRLFECLLGRQQRKASANPLAAFEDILGSSAARAQPSPPDHSVEAEHWAHGEYGWALFTAGRLKVRPLLSRLQLPAISAMHVSRLRGHMLCRTLGANWR